MIKDAKFKLRRGTAYEWAEKDPILDDGEPGVESDTSRLKIGNGMTPWSLLSYILPESDMALKIQQILETSDLGDFVLRSDLTNHIEDLQPHPAYDDGPSFSLLYQNAKV